MKNSQKPMSNQQFILRIEGEGECLQNAEWAWIRSVRNFKLKEKYKCCYDCFESSPKPEFTSFHTKVKVGVDTPFEFVDDVKVPINSKIKGHNGEVLHYLCIDAEEPYNDYLHIGFIYNKGSEVRGDFMGQTIIIKNAKNLNFDFSQNSKIGNKVKEKYAGLVDSDKRLECRNFWFGAYFYDDRINIL